MKKGTLMVFLSYVLWGLLAIFWKLLSDVDSVYVLCCRIIFSLVVSAVLLPFTGGWAEAARVFRDRRLLLRMLACGVLISFNWGTLIYCVSAGRVLDTSLAYYINPLMAILLGFVCFREKLNKAQWVSVAIAVVGVVAPMVMAGQFPWLAVLCALSFALYGAVKKGADVPGGVSTFVETLLVAPIALVVAVAMELNGGPVSTGAIAGWRLLLLPAAGVVTFLPVFLYSAGIRSTSMGISGILMYINPTLQLLCSILLFDETMSREMLVTFVCVWIATGVYLISGALESKKAAEGMALAAEVD